MNANINWLSLKILEEQINIYVIPDWLTLHLTGSCQFSPQLKLHRRYHISDSNNNDLTCRVNFQVLSLLVHNSLIHSFF